MVCTVNQCLPIDLVRVSIKEPDKVVWLAGFLIVVFNLDHVVKKLLRALFPRKTKRNK